MASFVHETPSVGGRRCQARNGQTHIRCQGTNIGEVVHAGDHWAYGADGLKVCWTELVAVYPGLGNDSADHTQVGGSHYSSMQIQPWAVIEALNLDFFQGNALKYLMRAGRKGPALEDLKKAKHYIEKCIEREESRDGR